MIDGIELASSGLDAYANVQETIARNLANANTVGFKKNMVSFRLVAKNFISLQRIQNRICAQGNKHV